ncbi:hypothetical protein [Alkalimarinus coralli]|uniref:hypothetical protein n=1 Tax=Alkalimarinus coralli TaxID=2935863 RepID=UPI00202AD3A4|nr:hypothetical protein [Alkalimarinus coralli]
MTPTRTTLFKRSLLASSIALALAACGGGSSSGTATTATTESLSGTVADGYLVNATVCLDINENKVCDEGEPSAVSTAGGEFTIEGATTEQLLKPLIVKVIAGVTSDEDGIEITSDYSMAAPAGYKFVSPLTTMVQQELENNDGFVLADAESSIKAKLGTDLDLSEDYVAGKASTEFTEEQKDEFQKLHHVAQVTATVIQKNMDAVNEAISGTDITFDQVLDMVVAKVLENLEAINSAVEQEGENFTVDNIATIANSNAIDESEKGTLVAEMEARKAAKEASAANLIELVSTVGINWFEADHHGDGLWLGYGTFSYNPETGESSDTEYTYNP